MSRLCAKPTCSDGAERWFDVSAAQCQVVERPGPTPSSIALCGAHAARFSAPSGWERIELAPDVAQPVSETGAGTPRETVAEPPESVQVTEAEDTDIDDAELDDEVAETAAIPNPSPRRQHTRDAPWFLANADDASDDADIGSSHSAADSGAGVPSTGSLLHRAFHGPDREVDNARALEAERESSGRRESRTKSTAVDPDDDGDVATVGDLASRRNARTPAASYDVELPFPPLDAEPHVAVS